MNMIPNLALDLLIGLAIGAALGLLGGGGSILTVPALVYVAGQSPQAAVTASLVIVGTNSVVGAYAHRRRGACPCRTALVFAAAGMLSAYLAARLAPGISPTALMIAFAVLMIVIGAIMLRPAPAAQAAISEGIRGDGRILLAGLAVGALTGVLGVGGGFLIVPALTLWVGLPMPQAVGASLLVIAANSAAGLAGRAGHIAIDWPPTLIFVAAGLAGSLIGSRLAAHLPAARLRQVFAVFVIVLGLALLFDQL